MPPSVSTAETAESWSQAHSPAFLSRLDRLRINVRGGTTLHPGGNPVAAATQDSGLEFAKHRPYVAGDDLRHIDWAALARSDTKLVRTFRAEREAPLHILVDQSASMGTPAEDHKPDAAAAIATSLAYISLRHRDPVRLSYLDESGAHQIAPLLRHPSRLPLVAETLRTHRPHGVTDLSRSVEGYLRLTRLPGLAVVISDFLVPAEDYQRALRFLRASGYAVAAIQLRGRHEREVPVRTRRVRVYDVETRRDRIVDLSPQNLDCYRQAMEEHDEALQAWCSGNAVPFCAIDTSEPRLVAMTSRLARAGIIR